MLAAAAREQVIVRYVEGATHGFDLQTPPSGSIASMIPSPKDAAEARGGRQLFRQASETLMGRQALGRQDKAGLKATRLTSASRRATFCSAATAISMRNLRFLTMAPSNDL